MVRHFLDIYRLDAADLRAIRDDAHARKAARKGADLLVVNRVDGDRGFERPDNDVLIMDAAGYTALTRQSGLMREMKVVANNIANLSTTGFRREGVIFAEHVARMDHGPSLSMASGSAPFLTM